VAEEETEPISESPEAPLVQSPSAGTQSVTPPTAVTPQPAGSQASPTKVTPTPLEEDEDEDEDDLDLDVDDAENTVEMVCRD